MSYASLIKTLPTPLRQPIGLAALGSLGIHGLLWTILPVLPLKSKPLAAQQPQTVGVVELTPSEQSRLPQVAPSPSAQQPSDLPPLPLESMPPPLPPESSVLPPLPPSSVPPPLPPESSVLPPLPPILATGSLASPGITYPPIANGLSRAPVSPHPTAGLLAPPKGIPLPKYPLRDAQPFTPPNNLSKSPEPEPRQMGSFPPPFTPPPNRGLPNLPLTAAQPLPPPPATALNPIPQGNINQPQNQETAKDNPQTNSAATSARPENPSDLNRQKLVAALLERQREQSEHTTPSAARIERLLESGRQQLQALRLRERYERTNPIMPGSNEPAAPVPYSNPSGAVSPATANRDALIEAYSKRQSEVQTEHPNVETKAPIYKTVNTCQKQLDHSVAVVGVVVNPQGNIIEGPDVLGQAVPSVKQAAENYVRGYVFSGNAKPANYQFHLEYKYNTGNCSEASPKPTTEKINNRQQAPKNLNSAQP